MAELGTKWPTLLDVAGRTDSNGSIKDVAEILHAGNEVLDDAPFIEANDGTGHKTTVRSGLPEPTWRLLNYGVQPTKSTTVGIRDTAGMVEDYAEVDKDLADLNGNAAAFRLSEDKAHIEGINRAVKRTLFYGNTATEPEKFMGLAPRFSDKSAPNGVNIIDAGGTGADLTSIWLIVWGPESVHMIYPKGSKAGLHNQDLGEVTLLDANGGRYQGYRTHYKWNVGLSVRDWRQVVRIANIATNQLSAKMTTGPDISDLMTQALEMVHNLNGGKAAFYMNRTLSSFLRRQIKNIPNVMLNLDEVAGKHVTTFDGVPVRRVDEILKTEARVL